MTTPDADSPRSAAVVVATVASAVVLLVAELGLAAGGRAVLDQRAYVSDLRLDAAMATFRPEPHPGLAKPLAVDTFVPEKNPRTAPAACAALTALATGPALDGRSWTGAGDRSLVPVTLLTVRFASADAARAELDRKRWAMLRCTSVDVTFPPFNAPATTYHVSGRQWSTSAIGSTTRWSLDGGGRQFEFYVVRYGNTLTWTYDDDVSSPAVRKQVADSLVTRLADLSRQ